MPITVHGVVQAASNVASPQFDYPATSGTTKKTWVGRRAALEREITVRDNHKGYYQITTKIKRLSKKKKP
jgi:hypothetical protein